MDAMSDKPVRCNCAIMGIPDRQCSRRTKVGTLCTQHAKMDVPGNRVFRWDWEDGKPVCANFALTDGRM